MTAGTPEREQKLAALTLQLGSFTTCDLADLTGISTEEVEAFLGGRPCDYEWVADQQTPPGFWRLTADLPLVAEESPSTSIPADLAEAQRLIREAEKALSNVERGSVQDPEARRLTLSLAEQRLSLGDKLLETAAPNEAAQPRQSLRAVRDRVKQLHGSPPAFDQGILDAMRDWTAPLRGSPECEPPEPQTLAATLDEALQQATAQAAIPGAVFGPAIAMLGAQLPPGREGRQLATDLGELIRQSALRGDVFRVLAIGFVAAVLRTDYTADALLAAITTPAFRGSCDRAAIRMAYAALANLARPGAAEPRIAAEACAYLLRRDHPGRDEMEMLSPAALHLDDKENPVQLLQIAEWLGWEQNRDPQDVGLFRLASVARNLGCTLDTHGYHTLEGGLAKLADKDLSIVLVNHLSTPRNGALHLSPLPETALTSATPRRALPTASRRRPIQGQYGAAPRDPVARVTGMKAPTPFEVKPASLAAQAIAQLMRAEIYDTGASGGPFSSRGFGGEYV